MSDPNTETDQLNFEDAFSQLEETVRQLEAGNLPLAEALALYEQGMALVQRCNSRLDQAELTIQRLTADGDTAAFDET